MMKHEKMTYTYVGVDLHKSTHTAVFLDCFWEKLGEITFENLPSKFPQFILDAKAFQQEGTTLLFGLEDTNSYGRTLTTFLTDNGWEVKHTNALLVARERKNQNITHKTDSVDAECAARVLLSKLGTLPAADPQDHYFILRTLVVRRDNLVKSNTRMKIYLHSLLTQHYPNYREFFTYIDGKTALAFFKTYPSPWTLENVTIEELTEFIADISSDYYGADKAEFIKNSCEDTAVQFQEIRDMTVQSTIRQIEFTLQEIENVEKSMAVHYDSFDCTLTSMAGIDVISACQILSCVGDIKRFSTPAKL